jgi:hypothetical protein
MNKDMQESLELRKKWRKIVEIRRAIMDLVKTEAGVEITLWSTVTPMIVAGKILDSLAHIKLGHHQKSIIYLVAFEGGYKVSALRQASLGSLLESEHLVVYKGMIYSRDVWE